jgi:hypothetical protein
VKANANEVKVTILQSFTSISPNHGHFSSLNDFAAYISEEDEDSRLVCTPISRDVRGFLFELTRKSFKENSVRAAKLRPDSFDETRFALAQGFTDAHGVLTRK